MGVYPNATVAATLAGTEYRDAYQRVGRGEYALRSSLENPQPIPNIDPTDETAEAEAETGAIRALGMYWQRDQVHWLPTRPQMFGRQSAGDLPIEFSEQIGTYLLHDRERVI